MSLRVRAVFRRGTFVPQFPCDFPEGSEVDLIVQDPAVEEPAVSDPTERARRLKELTDRMRQNPIPANAPRWTRDQLHDRR